MIMSIGQNIKKIREKKGLTQQSIAELIAMHRSNYSKIESGQRELSIDALHKISKFFGMSIDQIVTFEGNVPQEVTVEDKSLSEQIKLIQELDEEDKTIVFKMVDKMLTSKKFKEFFSKNVAAL